MIERHGLIVDDRLDDFIMREAMPGTGIEPGAFWRGFSSLIRDLAPKNRALLEKRDQLQTRIDAWWKTHPDASIAAQKDFLTEIGYLLPEGPDFKIETTGIDPEIATIAERHDLEIPVVAHAGDGNLHPGIVYPPGDLAARDRAGRAFDELLALATTYGGTITGEHGVGKAKSAWLSAYLGDDATALTRRIKTALDPAGILNPGAILPAE